MSDSVICRLCATDVGPFVPIFGENGEKMELLEKISRCTPILVHTEDTLSRHVCQCCIEKLNVSSELVITAINTDILLKSKYKMSDDFECEIKSQEINGMDWDEDEEFGDPDQVIGVSCDEGGVIMQRKKSRAASERDSERQPVISNNDDILSAGDCDSFIRDVYSPAECDICNQLFTDIDGFDEHVSTQHLLDEPFQCFQCDESFPELPDLLYHKLDEHSGDVVCCDNCSSKGYLDFEAGSYCEQQTLSIFECKFCSAIFGVKNCLEEHYAECHPNNNSTRPEPGTYLVFKCKACGEVFPNENDLNEHTKLLQSSSMILNCSKCSKRFCRQEKLDLHSRIHEKEYQDQFKCKVCSYTFSDNQALTIHLKSHTGIKSHMCDVCYRTFDRLVNMIKHRKLHKPVQEHTCNQSGEGLGKRDEMIAHVERVDDCVKIAQTATKRRKGEGKGRGNQFKWTCHLCGKQVSSKPSLKQHEHIHTDTRPYICEWCGQRFRFRPNLLQHHVTHTGERPYSCQFCDKRFSRKSFITAHMRVHTGEKPYECDVCGRRFSQCGDMRRHKKRHDLK